MFDIKYIVNYKKLDSEVKVTKLCKSYDDAYAYFNSCAKEKFAYVDVIEVINNIEKTVKLKYSVHHEKVVVDACFAMDKI